MGIDQSGPAISLDRVDNDDLTILIVKEEASSKNLCARKAEMRRKFWREG